MPGRVALLALCLGFVASCGAVDKHAVSDRAGQALATALAGVNATRDAFTAFDAERQAEIVERATSEATGQGQLLAYRVSRRAVVKLFVSAYVSLAAAAQALALYEASSGSGVASALEVVGKLKDAQTAIASVKTAIDAIKDATP